MAFERIRWGISDNTFVFFPLTVAQSHVTLTEHYDSSDYYQIAKIAS